MEEIKSKRNKNIKVSLLWNVVIVCVALALGLLTAILVPPLPEFSVAFASASAENHLNIGLSVTNSAAAAMSYDSIAAAAFVPGGLPFAAASASDMKPFEQSGGERSHVWFSLDSSALPAEVASARIVVWARATYGGAAWPWKETPMTVVCDGVRVAVSPFDTWRTVKGEEEERPFKCEVDGKWRWRERWMFVGVFLVPFLLYLVVLYFQNFVTCSNFVGSGHY